RAVEAGDKAEFDWVGASDEDDGNGRSCGLDRKHCWWAERDDHRHMVLHEIDCHPRQRTITIRYPPVFDRHVPPLAITHFRKTAAECGIEMHGIGLRQATEISDYRHRLLRARGERPRCNSATKREDK